MNLAKCQKHQLEFQLPSTDQEFFSCKLHEEVEKLVEHHESFPGCKLEVSKDE